MPRSVGFVNTRLEPRELLSPIFPPPIVMSVLALGVPVEPCDSWPRTLLYNIRSDGREAAMQPMPISTQEKSTM